MALWLHEATARATARYEANRREVRGRPGPFDPRYRAQLDRLSARQRFDCLTRRERDVVELVLAGLTNEQIGRELQISVKTVQTHRNRINFTLGVHSTTDLVLLAHSLVRAA